MATLKRWNGTAWEYVGLPTSSAIAGALGYAAAVADQGGITTATALNGLTVTITVPSARRIKVTGVAYFQNSAVNANAGARMFIQRDGVNVQQADHRLTAAGVPEKYHIEFVETLTAGTYTYRLTADNGAGGTVTMIAGAAYPAFILVEDITGVGVSGHTHTELEDTGWIAFPLANGWVAYDANYGPPRYRRKNGIVYVQGLVKNGTLGVSAGQLPAGFRTNMGTLLFTVSRDTNVWGRIDVVADGNFIMAAAATGWTSFNGIIYPADA